MATAMYDTKTSKLLKQYKHLKRELEDTEEPDEPDYFAETQLRNIDQDIQSL